MNKAVGFEIKGVKDSGEFEAILSMPIVDRDGEVIDAKAFEPLPEHIPIDVDHGLSVMSTVGSGQPFYEGDVLKFKGTFASTPLAQEVRSLVLEGHVRKMSVFYMNAKYETDDSDGLPHLRKGELLNAAIVAIPANREASILAAKEFKASKAATIQEIHDLAHTAGAECKHEPKSAPIIAADAKGAVDALKQVESAIPADDAVPPAPAEVTPSPATAVARAHAEAASVLAGL